MNDRSQKEYKMADSLFAPTPTPAIDPGKDYLPELVGEGKRYKDPSALAYATMHANAQITSLERETKELRDQLAQRIKMEDFVDKIEKISTTSPSTVVTPTPEPDTRTADTTPVDVDALLDQKIAEREALNVQKRNLMEVKDKLTEVLGPDFAAKVEHQARELNVSTSELNQLAASSPQAFYRLLGLGQSRSEPFQAPPTSNLNSGGFQPSNKEKTMAYYKAEQKKNPKLYLDKDFANEMHKQAIKLGEAFFDA